MKIKEMKALYEKGMLSLRGQKFFIELLMSDIDLEDEFHHFEEKESTEFISDNAVSRHKKFVEHFFEVYEELEKQTKGGLVYEKQFIQELVELRYTEQEVEDYLQKKKNYGELFSPKEGYLKRVR